MFLIFKHVLLLGLDVGRKYYTWEEAIRVFKHIEPPDIFVDELIFLVLGVLDKPVQCRYVLMNEAFIFYELLKNKLKVVDPEFEPTKYGAYSLQILELLAIMSDHNNIYWKNYRNAFRETFGLTESGKEFAGNVLTKVESKLGRLFIENLKVLRKGLDEMGYFGVINYMRQHYPEWVKS